MNRIQVLILQVPQVLQAPRDSAFDVENPTAKSIKKNAEPRMPNVMVVALQVTSRNVARSQVTS